MIKESEYEISYCNKKNYFYILDNAQNNDGDDNQTNHKTFYQSLSRAPLSPFSVFFFFGVCDIFSFSVDIVSFWNENDYNYKMSHFTKLWQFKRNVRVTTVTETEVNLKGDSQS